QLVHIDVPDLAQDVAKKEAIVEQRKREVKCAESFTLRAKKEIEIAEADIDEKHADVREADATTAFRKQELARFEGLAREDKAITENIVEERRKFYEAAVAAGARARAAVVKSRAAKSGAEAKFDEAKADVKLKEALVRVAEEDVKLAR